MARVNPQICLRIGQAFWWDFSFSPSGIMGLCGKVLVAGGCRGGLCEKSPEAAPCLIRNRVWQLQRDPPLSRAEPINDVCNSGRAYLRTGKKSNKQTIFFCRCCFLVFHSASPLLVSNKLYYSPSAESFLPMMIIGLPVLISVLELFSIVFLPLFLWGGGLREQLCSSSPAQLGKTTTTWKSWNCVLTWSFLTFLR